MSRLEEIQEEYSIEIGYQNWDELIKALGPKTRRVYEHKVCKKYAAECVKATSKNLIENHSYTENPLEGDFRNVVEI